MTNVRVSTPSRLHFGLLRLHETATVSYGGLGMMIDRPRVEIAVSPSDDWKVSGPDADRAEQFARLALDATPWTEKPRALCVRVASSIAQHRGLGGGSQLALSVAAAIRRLAVLPPGTATELAAAVSRGARSAVGSHGFVHGGLIWERGRAPGANLAELTSRVAGPPGWRIVLVAPLGAQGISGVAEQSAFATLPPVPVDVTRRLTALAEEQILPAARESNIAAFGESVYEYGRRSGECFAAIQGGPYASPAVAACVAAIRACGVPGAGQSSWGPTVFAVTANDAAAEDLVARLQRDGRWSSYEFAVAAPDNRGAVVDAGTSDYSNP